MSDELKNDSLMPDGDGAEQQNLFVDPNQKDKPKKPAKQKASKPTKADKDAAKEAAANKSKAQKQWEDGLVATKRVKREERRRKWKKAFLFLLVISLVITSTVYIMLLLIEENSIRITATSHGDKAITLSYDRTTWRPYLDVKGPDGMWNITYNPDYTAFYEKSPVPSLADAKYAVENDGIAEGNLSGNNLIAFYFYLRNDTDQEISINYQMTMLFSERYLADSIRIVWAESSNRGSIETTSNCYAAMSTNPALIEYNGGIEKIAYPTEGSYPTYPGQAEIKTSADMTAENFRLYDEKLTDLEKERTGWIDTIPFVSDTQVFAKTTKLAGGEIARFFVYIWIEGSDFDCLNKALGTYVTLGANFEVI